jgi:hypothetical protein
MRGGSYKMNRDGGETARNAHLCGMEVMDTGLNAFNQIPFEMSDIVRRACLSASIRI